MGSRETTGTKKANNGANLGFEQKLWQAADKLRGHMDAAEYKHVVLGLIFFLKYISDAFQEKYQQLSLLKQTEQADPEDRDEYAAENIFWVPKEARWSHLITSFTPSPRPCSAPWRPPLLMATGGPVWFGIPKAAVRA